MFPQSEKEVRQALLERMNGWWVGNNELPYGWPYWYIVHGECDLSEVATQNARQKVFAPLGNDRLVGYNHEV